MAAPADASVLQDKDLSTTRIFYYNLENAPFSTMFRHKGAYDVTFRFLSERVREIVQKVLQAVKENPFAFDLTQAELPFSDKTSFFLRIRPSDPNSQETCVACYRRIRSILENAGFTLPAEGSDCIESTRRHLLCSK